MFDFTIYFIKPPHGEERSGYYFGLWGVLNEITDGDTSDIPNCQILEWSEKLNHGRAVNFRGFVIRKCMILREIRL